MLNKLLSLCRSAVDDYSMIDAGDRICVGLSGGKDSLSALVLLANLRRFYPKPFELCAATIDMGFEGTDLSRLERLCASLGVPYSVKKTNIGEIIFDLRREKNPCSLCAKMRRGALSELALSLGCNKVALGHHTDDVIETFFLSLLYEGRIYCFAPVTYLSRTDLYQIRPLIYIRERSLRAFSENFELPVVFNPCPANGSTRRQYVKELIASLSQGDPTLASKLFGAVQRSDIPGWKR